MDPLLKILVVDNPMSAPPQHSFEQADQLFQQAAALRREAEITRKQLDFIYGRADILTNTAKGLQEIASRDRDVLQVMWEGCLRLWKEELEVYVLEPKKATYLNKMRSVVEDGMANAAGINVFLRDVKDYFFAHARTRKLASPEPEAPAEYQLPLLAESLLRSGMNNNSTLKRGFSTSSDAYEAGPDTIARMRKRMRPTHESDENTLINYTTTSDATDMLTNHSESKDRGTAYETSEEEESDTSDANDESESESHGNPQALEAYNEEGISSSINNSHATNEACAFLNDENSADEHSDDDDSDSEHSDDDDSDSEQSSTSDGGSSPCSGTKSTRFAP